VHFGLSAMTADSCRRYGGVGLSVWHACADLLVRRAGGAPARVAGVEHQQARRLAAVLDEADLAGVDIEVMRSMPVHVGIGSGTSLLLAGLEGASIVLGAGLTEMELVRASRRGGASGVGVNTYFNGGLVGDGGHRQSASDSFLPSSYSRPQVRPPLAFRLDWPPEWTILLGMEPTSRGLSGDAEAKFFSRNAPMSRSDCAEVAMALFFELPAAVVDRDFAGMRGALRSSRLAGFKAREIGLQPEVAQILEVLDGWSEVACTMSSFGPTVFAACEHPVAAEEVHIMMCDLGLSVVRGQACASGRVVEIDGILEAGGSVDDPVGGWTGRTGGAANGLKSGPSLPPLAAQL
jgi:beta-ribofuranosylaminobenzene 5'-phosphate synthase